MALSLERAVLDLKYVKSLPALNLPPEWVGVNTKHILSLPLRVKIEKEGINGPDVLAPIQNWPQVKETAKILLAESGLRGPYHDFLHGMDVAHTFSSYLRELEKSEVLCQLGWLVAAFHDYGHVRTRYRCDGLNAVPFRDLSNEEFAAIAFTVAFPDLTASQLLWGYRLILATSFGQRPGGKDREVNERLAADPHLIRDYQPETLWEQLIHLSDINRTQKGLLASLEGEIRFDIETTPYELDSPRMRGMGPQEMLERHQNFLAYVKLVIDKLPNYPYMGDFVKLRHKELTSVVEAVERLVKGKAAPHEVSIWDQLVSAYNI